MKIYGGDIVPDFIVRKRPRKEYVQMTCRLEVDLLEELRTIVAQNGLSSVNVLINDSIKFALDNIEIKED